MSHKSLGKYGYIVHKNKLDKETEIEVKTCLRVTPLVNPLVAEFAPPKPYFIYQEDDERLYLPRFWAEEFFGPPDFTSFNKHITYPPLEKEPEMSLLPHQVKAWEALDKHFDPTSPTGGGGVLSVPPGYGKTRLSVWKAWKMRLKTLIVVNKEFLADQWEREIEKVVPEALPVGRIQGSRFDAKDHYFTIAIVNTIAGGRYEVDMFNQFGLCIVDEVHHIGSEFFSQALPHIFTKFTLGLSATPNRADGTSNVIYSYLGPLFHHEKRPPSSAVKIWMPALSPSLDKAAYVEIKKPTPGTGRMMRDANAMSLKLSQSKARNKLIVQYAMSLLENKACQLIIFSRYRAQLEWFKHEFDELRISCGYYWGRTSERAEEYDRMLDETAKCRVVLCTTGMGAYGLDIPTLNSLIFASPPGCQLDLIDQMVGRIMRKVHKDYNPLIIDPVDDLGNFKRHASLRKSYYGEMEFTITK